MIGDLAFSMDPGGLKMHMAAKVMRRIGRKRENLRLQFAMLSGSYYRRDLQNLKKLDQSNSDLRAKDRLNL